MEMLGSDVTRMPVIVLPEEDEYVYRASYCFVQSTPRGFAGHSKFINIVVDSFPDAN